MNKNIVKLTELTIERLKQRLQQNTTLPIEMYFETDNILVLFSIKHNSTAPEGENILTVGVNNKSNDLMFSNILEDGTMDKISGYLSSKEGINSIKDKLEKLIIKLEQREDIE